MKAKPCGKLWVEIVRGVEMWKDQLLLALFSYGHTVLWCCG